MSTLGKPVTENVVNFSLNHPNQRGEHNWLTTCPLIRPFPQRAHDAIITLSWCQNDVTTSFDVMMTLFLCRVSGEDPVRVENTTACQRHQLETFSVLLVLCEGKPRTSHRWTSLTKASGAELWCFLWPAPEQTVEQTIETLMNWYAIALIMTSL